MTETRHRQQVPAPGEDTSEAAAGDGYDMQDLGATDEAPPAYGDHMDQLQLSQAGFEAGASVTSELLSIQTMPLPLRYRQTTTSSSSSADPGVLPLGAPQMTAESTSTSTRRTGSSPRS